MNKPTAVVSNEERELVFEIACGMPSLIHWIGHLRLISQDAKDVGYMDILRYLKRENLKGWNLKSWIDERQDGSLLQTIAFVRAKVHSDRVIRKIYTT